MTDVTEAWTEHAAWRWHDIELTVDEVNARWNLDGRVIDLRYRGPLAHTRPMGNSENYPITPAIWKKLVSLMRRRAGVGADAEDLVQEAYARLIEQSSKTTVRNPQGFIFRAATNLAITASRSRLRHGVAEADPAVMALLSPSVSTQHEVLEARERLRVVELAIDQLPPRARQVFVLHRVEGLTYSEIARVLDISVSAVEKNMARALMHLAMKVQEFGQSRDGRKSHQS